MTHPLAHDPVSFAELFSEARSQRAFLDKAVDPSVIESLYDLAKWGPTSMNCSPARFLFVSSEKAKAILADCAMGANQERVKAAPFTAVIATDMQWFDQLPKLFPHNASARDNFASKPEVAEVNGFRNGTLQGAYLMIAARAHGLDCAPMSGFDAEKLHATFFQHDPERQNWKPNWICPMGYGDKSKLHPRGPRLSFEEACLVV